MVLPTCGRSPGHFFDKGEAAAKEWVADQAHKVLQVKVGQVAAASSLSELEPFLRRYASIEPKRSPGDVSGAGPRGSSSAWQHGPTSTYLRVKGGCG